MFLGAILCEKLRRGWQIEQYTEENDSWELQIYFPRESKNIFSYFQVLAIHQKMLQS